MNIDYTPASLAAAAAAAAAGKLALALGSIKKHLMTIDDHQNLEPSFSVIP